jgi:hypothetical protein
MGAGEEVDLVDLEEGLEEITTADVEEVLDLVVAGVLPETFAIQVCLIELDRGTLVAHHKLLEVEEAEIP